MIEVDLSTTIADVAFDGYIMNASGPKCTTFQELEAIGNSQSSAIVTKSCTKEFREGNVEPRYADLPHGSIQSMGLPNLGYQAYIDMIPDLKKFNKPIIVSISGLSLADNLEMVKAFQSTDADMIEVNFSCPNIQGKPQVAYDFEQTENALKQLRAICDKPMGIKLAPYFDMSHTTAVANIIKQYPVEFITTINSLGNTLVIDPVTEAPVIKPKGGFGGLCGEYVKPVGLANVRAFRELLPESTKVIGVGGINTGTDAFEYLLAGADAVQIATTFEQQGTPAFARIETELKQLMQSKGYTKLDDAKGKLKQL